MIVQIGRREEFDKKLLGEMHKLRAQVFKERKGWDVSVIDEMEIDGYDALSPYYMLIQEDTPEAQVFGCWRILDTTGPYMLKNTFPELLHGKEAPCSPHIWELSRFAINSGQKGSLGFSDCTLEAMRALARYSLQNDIQTLVTVTTVGVEKMMIRAGLDVSRFGPHLKIGIERAVALRIELNAKTQILQRYRSLYAERAVSRQLLDQQQATVDQLRATLKANDATINAERVRLSYTRITSPVSGKVGIRNVDVGNLVRVGDSLGLFSVTQIAPISVVFSLQQEQLPQLQALLGGEAAVRAYSRDGGSALGEGRLLTIDNQIDSSTGTIRVRASFDNRQARLWPGQFVAVSLHTGVRRDQLVLSSKAVRRGLEGNFVYRVAADRVEAVPVRVLQDIDGLSVVEGLASGDQVVVDGHSRLMPGALVDIQEPRPSLAQATERRP